MSRRSRRMLGASPSPPTSCAHARRRRPELQDLTVSAEEAECVRVAALVDAQALQAWGTEPLLRGIRAALRSVGGSTPVVCGLRCYDGRSALGCTPRELDAISGRPVRSLHRFRPLEHCDAHFENELRRVQDLFTKWRQERVEGMLGKSKMSAFGILQGSLIEAMTCFDWEDHGAMRPAHQQESLNQGAVLVFQDAPYGNMKEVDGFLKDPQGFHFFDKYRGSHGARLYWIDTKLEGPVCMKAHGKLEGMLSGCLVPLAGLQAAQLHTGGTSLALFDKNAQISVGNGSRVVVITLEGVKLGFKGSSFLSSELEIESLEPVRNVVIESAWFPFVLAGTCEASSDFLRRLLRTRCCGRLSESNGVLIAFNCSFAVFVGPSQVQNIGLSIGASAATNTMVDLDGLNSKIEKNGNLFRPSLPPASFAEKLKADYELLNLTISDSTRQRSLSSCSSAKTSTAAQQSQDKSPLSTISSLKSTERSKSPKVKEIPAQVAQINKILSKEKSDPIPQLKYKQISKLLINLRFESGVEFRDVVETQVCKKCNLVETVEMIRKDFDIVQPKSPEIAKRSMKRKRFPKYRKQEKEISKNHDPFKISLVKRKRISSCGDGLEVNKVSFSLDHFTSAMGNPARLLRKRKRLKGKTPAVVEEPDENLQTPQKKKEAIEIKETPRKTRAQKRLFHSPSNSSASPCSVIEASPNVSRKRRK